MVSVRGKVRGGASNLRNGPRTLPAPKPSHPRTLAPLFRPPSFQATIPSMRRCIVVALFAAALFATAIRAVAQTQTPAADPVQGPTFRTGVDVVSIDVAVID